MDNGILNDIVLVRGGGDIATGVVQKLFRAGVKVAVLEIQNPTAIRRTVSLCEAVTRGVATVEDMTARLADSLCDCGRIWETGEIPVLIDPNADSARNLSPTGVIDAVLAKRNLGTSAGMAPVVIALGPGFTAPRDAHAVIETMRGHSLGKVIFDGSALPDTGEPGIIAGKGVERVLRAPCAGVVKHEREIGDIVKKGDVLFWVGDTPVAAPFDGVLRGLIAQGIYVCAGMKSGDIDPRIDSDCRSISDKARCIGGAVLEAYLYLRRKI